MTSFLLYDCLLLLPNFIFSLKLTRSVYYRLMLPSLWTPTAPCGSILEVHFDVDGPPRSVLVHQPQHHQDVPDIQGEKCLPHLIFFSLIHFLSADRVQHD